MRTLDDKTIDFSLFFCSTGPIIVIYSTLIALEKMIQLVQ